MKKIFNGMEESCRGVVLPMLNDIVFLESQLNELRKLPFIETNPKNPAQQRATVAAKQYKELIQQYNACIKTLLTAMNRNGVEEESPLREYLKTLKG